MPIAYGLIVHRAPRQVARLVGALSHPDASIVVHVDAKADQAPFRTALRPYDVTFTRRAVPVRWGGFSLVHSLLLATEEALAARPDASHVVIMSGQDYPLKSNAAILDFFAGHHNQDFLHHRALPEPKWPFIMDRLEEYHYTDAIGLRANRRLRPLRRLLPRRRIPLGMRPYWGEMWCNFSRAGAEYLLGFLREHPEVLRYFRYTLLTEEHLPQMVLLNSPRADRVRNSALRLIDWPEEGAHPRTLTAADARLVLDAPAGDLFARKFDIDTDAAILDLIDAQRGAGVAASSGVAAASPV